MAVPFLSGDKAFFDLFLEAGRNALRSARLLQEMLASWPDSAGLEREVLKCEQEGDRITHDIVRRLNASFSTPLERDDIYALATQLDDIVDNVEEVADLLVLYKIEATMEQAERMAAVLVAACEELEAALAGLRRANGLERHWIEIHRLENEGDRISREAVASLFAEGIDPMVVIRWKDVFDLLEQAVDATEKAAHVLEGVAIKRSRRRLGRLFGRGGEG